MKFISSLIHRIKFKFSKLRIWWIDFPADLKYKFNVWKYGGVDNVPVSIKNEYAKALTHNAMKDMDLEDEVFLKFIGGAISLKNIFNLDYEDSHVLCYIINDINGHQNDYEIESVMNKILQDDYPLKAFLKYLVDEIAVRQDQVDFHLANNTNNINEIIGWKHPSKQLTLKS